MTFYSQCEQDFFLENAIFKGFKNGIFVDIGAHDGRWINNTLYFEETHNWNGINVEPIPDVYAKLIINRPRCININCAIDEFEGTSDFCLNVGYSEAISGLVSHYDERHKQRIINEQKSHASTSNKIMVNTMRLDKIFNAHNVKHINYLSVEVEGAEFAVLKSINYNDVFIDVIGFENNYEDTSMPIIQFLLDKGFVMIKKYTDIFMIHTKSEFYKK